MNRYEQPLDMPAAEDFIGDMIKDASEGSAIDCMDVMHLAGSMQLPVSLIPTAMEMFAKHMMNGHPPEKLSRAKFRLAEISFYGVAATGSAFIRFMDGPLPLTFVEAWPSILDWAHARYIRKVRDQERLDDSPLLMTIVGLLLDSLLRSRFDLPLDLFDRRLIEMTMRLHSSPHATLPCIMTCICHFDFYIDASMAGKKAPLETSLRNALDILLSAAQNDPTLILNPVHDFLNRVGLEEDRERKVGKCMHFLSRLSALSDHPVAKSVKDNSYPAVSKAVSLLAKKREDTHDDGEFTDVAGLYMGIVSIFSGPRIGTTWLLQALKDRLLHHIVPYSHLKFKLVEQRVSVVKDLLWKNLPAHLIDPYVIFETEAALSGISPAQHEQLMGSSLADAWKAFIRRFFEQYVFYCYFEVAGFHKGCNKCGTGASGEKLVSLKKCAACKIIEYCSTECQKTDWKEHKKSCKALRDKKRGPLPRWAANLFRRRLAAYDARRHLPGIRAVVAQKYPGFPVQATCVNINYGSFPPVVVVTLFTDISTADHLLYKQLQDPVIRALTFDDIRLHDGSASALFTADFLEGDLSINVQKFHWSMPYFCTNFGTRCHVADNWVSSVQPYVNENEREMQTAWSVVDEIAYRGGLSPEMILEGKMGEIRRKVLEVITREKAHMRMIDVKAPS